MSGEVCWGVVGGEGSHGKRRRGRCRKVCWDVGGGTVRKDVWGVEKCGRVYGVSGEVCCHVGRGVGKHVWV